MPARLVTFALTQVETYLVEAQQQSASVFVLMVLGRLAPAAPQLARQVRF
jgi:hypothetical protein